MPLHFATFPVGTMMPLGSLVVDGIAAAEGFAGLAFGAERPVLPGALRVT